MRRKILAILDVVIFGLVALLTNQFIAVCYLFGVFDPRKCEIGQAYWQIRVLVIIALLILWFIRYEHYESEFRNVWKKNWLVFAFICFALLSLSWSVYLPVTFLRAVLLLLLSVIASYFGLRFSVYKLLNFIAITFGVFALASLFLGLLFPDLAIMSNTPYEGMWRGVFWHKVYLGAEMALGYLAYLIILFSAKKQYTVVQKTFAAMMIFICLGLAILSDSASGLIVFAIQTCSFILLLTWLSWRHLIPRKAYMILGGIIVLVFILLASNLQFVFGLFNRSTSMTGRVPLWLHLLNTYVSERPLLGYGIGTFWYQPGISQKIQLVVGWGYGVGVSDNGYMDILLGLGAVGLLLFLGILATGFWRTLRVGFQTRDLVAFFPSFVLIHIFFINISLSYFLETESFIWFILAIIMFMYSRPDPEISQG